MMLRKYLLPAIAVSGAIFGLLAVFWSSKQEKPAPIPSQPPRSPYEHAIYGAGMIRGFYRKYRHWNPFYRACHRDLCGRGG